MRKRFKYNNTPTTIDGIKFDSKAEGKRYTDLKLLEKVKNISDLQLQVAFELQSSFTDSQGVKHRSINYVADFVYKEGDKVVVEDLKSKITAENPVYRIKKKLLLYIFRSDEDYINYEFKEVIK